MEQENKILGFGKNEVQWAFTIPCLSLALAAEFPKMNGRELGLLIFIIEEYQRKQSCEGGGAVALSYGDIANMMRVGNIIKTPLSERPNDTGVAMVSRMVKRLTEWGLISKIKHTNKTQRFKQGNPNGKSKTQYSPNMQKLHGILSEFYNDYPCFKQ